jgi:hypothetical protein
MEFPQPEDVTVPARAAGLYRVISNLAPGTYRIANFSHGVRLYKHFMEYYIQVL